MTSQIAVQLRVLFLVAVDTEFHLKVVDAQPVHRCHIAVALRTFQFAEFNMRQVPEFHEIRHEEDSHPGHRHPIIEMLLFLNDLRVLWNNIFMAKKAFAHLGKSCVFAAFYIRMTEPAVDLLDARVNPVAEIDRLNGAYELRWEPVKEIYARKRK